jgi:hypothetical protein
MDAQRLSGFELDVAVLRALGLSVTGDETVAAGAVDAQVLALVGAPGHSPFIRSPSREWAVGGLLIERNGIALEFDGEFWNARCRTGKARGGHPLEAAMRALVSDASAVMGEDRRKGGHNANVLVEALWYGGFTTRHRRR